MAGPMTDYTRRNLRRARRLAALSPDRNRRQRAWAWIAGWWR